MYGITPPPAPHYRRISSDISLPSFTSASPPACACLWGGLQLRLANTSAITCRAAEAQRRNSGELSDCRKKRWWLAKQPGQVIKLLLSVAKIKSFFLPGNDAASRNDFHSWDIPASVQRCSHMRCGPETVSSMSEERWKGGHIYSSIRSKQIVDMNILWSVVYCILTSLTEWMPQSKCRECVFTGPGRGMQEWAAHSPPFLPETLQSASTSTSQPGSAVVVSYGRDTALQCCSAACCTHSTYSRSFSPWGEMTRDDWLLCITSADSPPAILHHCHPLKYHILLIFWHFFRLYFSGKIVAWLIAYGVPHYWHMVRGQRTVPNELNSCKGLSIYYVSSNNKAGSVGMLTNAYLREQRFIKKLMSYENQH